MNGFKVILKSPMMAVVMTITSLLFIRFLLKYNSSRNIVLCEWNKHTFSCYFPLSIRTRLVLSFEFDNICSVNIHISYDNKEHEHIWRLQQQQKNQKTNTVIVLFEIHVSQSIEFCHCANIFLSRNWNFKILFLWLPIDLLFCIPRKKLITRAMWGNTMAFSEARGAAIEAIHHESFPDRLFFIILIQRKNRHSIRHPSNWTPTTNLRTIIQNFD